MEATLKPVPTESEFIAVRRPSTVPLITPLSKPNRKPPMVATQVTARISARFSSATAVWTESVRECSLLLFTGYGVR